jgi:hypothetical protein
MSTKQKQKAKGAVGRRAFLKGAAVAGGAAILATGESAVAATDQLSADLTADAGYQESGHVRDYYKTTRL